MDRLVRVVIGPIKSDFISLLVDLGPWSSGINVDLASLEILMDSKMTGNESESNGNH